MTIESDFDSATALSLNRLLVVISPDLIHPGMPHTSALLRRAVELAKATNASIELFHVCDELLASSSGAATSDDRERTLELDATLLAEIAARLRSEGVTITHEVRRDEPREEAILRKIHESRPDLVMKQSREHRYLVGLSRNTDWELIRQSPAHVWFVQGTHVPVPVSRLVTAVGSDDDADVITASDYDVLHIADHVARTFCATNYAVHAYRVPLSLTAYSSYRADAGLVGGQPGELAAMTAAIARKHRASAQAFAGLFGLPPGRVIVAEGAPRDVVTAQAKHLGAQLIVMGATNLERWERVLKTAEAEPTLSEAPCDVLFVKQPDVSPPSPATRPTTGSAPIDVARAIGDPERYFGSPQAVAAAPGLSPGLRLRILRAWEQDIRSELREDDDGGVATDSRAELLRQISSALHPLQQSARTPARSTLEVEEC